MSLTADDLQAIRTLLREEVSFLFDKELAPIKGEIQALRNDIKEVYGMVGELQRDVKRIKLHINLV